MGRKNRRSKQMNFVRIGGMLLVVYMVVLYVPMEDAVAASKDTPQVYTSTESVLDKSYEELVDSLDTDIFGEYLSTLEQGNSYIIPGLDQTNIRNEMTSSGMIPQGICVTEDYLLISAYDKSQEVASDSRHRSEMKQKSVLYVMDVESRQYLTTITMDTKCHVGALAYNPDDRIVYIADSANGVVQKLSYDKIVACVEKGNDAESDIVKFDDDSIDTQGYTPSFLAYYQEHLYIGQFARCKQKEWLSNRMVAFERDGTLVEQDTIAIPYYAQGVAFADWRDKTYMLISASYGRNRTAKLYVYLMEQQQDGSMKSKRKVGDFVCPNMSEDIDVQGDYIYTCFESASNFYRLSLDDNGESRNVVDRIMVSSFNKTIAKLLTGDEQRYVQTIRSIAMQYDRHNRIYMDIDQRRRLFLRLS